MKNKVNLTFKEWYNLNHNAKVNYVTFERLPFEYQLGVYLKYLEIVWFLVPAAFNTGYLIYDFTEDPVKYVVEADNLEAKATLDYWKIVIGLAFKEVKIRHDRQINPF